MTDDARAAAASENPPPTQPPRLGKRKLLIKAALVGTTMPVVMTIGRSASAHISFQCTYHPNGSRCQS